MRGRLIFTFWAELYRLDPQAMAGPDGPATPQRGYDPDFKEPALFDADDDGVGERVRAELVPVRLPCQVEPHAVEALRMLATGNAPRSQLELIFHFADLERRQLVDAATGEALIRPGTRLGALYDGSGTLLHVVRTPPGLYATEARPIGFGLDLGRSRRNLLLVSFADRPQGSMRLG